MFSSLEVKFLKAFGVFEKKDEVLCHVRLNFEVHVLFYCNFKFLPISMYRVQRVRKGKLRKIFSSCRVPT